jgi:hypothetical protein
VVGLRPRFLIEAGFIVAVAVVAGLADFSTWTIIGVVAAAWIVVALVELAVWARRTPRQRRDLAPARPDPGSSPQPVVIRASKRKHDPEPEPEPAAVDAPREWNLWELERGARDHTTDDVAKNEERAYLLIYLREFAGPDGTLPADFDGLIRDAFGDLVHLAGT